MGDLTFRVLQAALNIFLVVGPTGAGKTTLIRALLAARFFPGKKVARIFNDDGSFDEEGVSLTDAGRPVEGESLVPLIAGCFGCSDKASFFGVMDKIRAANDYTWVVIDPLGFASGDELTGIINEWATRAHATINLKVLGVVNVEEIREAQRVGVLASQLAAANVGIALNRVPAGVSSIEDEALASVFEIIDASAASAPVFLLGDDLVLPASVRDAVHRSPSASKMRLRAQGCGHGCGHDHSHEHHHDHDEGHVHGHAQHVRLHFLLRPTLSREEVIAWFDAYFTRTLDHGIFRMKGAASDAEVQRGFANWGERWVATTGVPFLTLYVQETGVAGLDDFVEIMAPAHPSGLVHGSTRALLRRADRSSDENNALVRWLLEHLPTKVVMVAHGPVTNPELHELLNEVRKREGVDPALNAEAIQRRVGYYLDCLAVLRPDSMYWNAPGAAERKRMLAIGVGWFCARKAEEVGAVLLRQAKENAVLLGCMLADGLNALESHNSDLGVALEAADETGDTVRFLLASGDPTQLRLMLSCPVDHAVELARRDGRPDLLETWSRVRALLD